MSVVNRLSDVLHRRRVQVAVAVVALGGAVTAVAVANISLLGVAGGAQDDAGGLSSRLDLGPTATRPPATTAALTTTSRATATAPATPPATTRAPTPTTTTTTATTATSPLPGPATTTTRDDDHGAPDRDGGDEGARDGDD